MRTTDASVFAVLLCICFSASAQSVQERLERVLTREQQEALDLDGMTSVQKEALRDVLAAAYAAGREKGREESSKLAPSVAPSATSSKDVIETQIDGDFEGWEGETIVKLMNGQIWQQTEYHYHYHYAFMPDVVIYSSAGGYKMKVEGVDKAVRVRQLK
jgi:hypothetical protein